MSTRTDDDLERLLRTTLGKRAATVTDGPRWTGSPDPARPRRQRTAWLVAATIVAVLAAATTIVVFRVNANDRTPPAGPPKPDYTTFGVRGYPATARTTFPDGARQVIVRTPHATPAGNVSVLVYAPHGYRFTPLQQQQRVVVSGHRGYSGVGANESYRGHHRPLHAVVWQFAPAQWAVVQQVGNLRVVPTMEQLVAVARASVPTEHLALPFVPFRLGFVPPGFVLNQIGIDLVQHSTQVVFRGPRQSFLSVYAGPSTRLGHDADSTVHGDTVLYASIVGPRSGQTPADKRLAARLRHDVVWQPTPLAHVVP